MTFDDTLTAINPSDVKAQNAPRVAPQPTLMRRTGRNVRYRESSSSIGIGSSVMKRNYSGEPSTRRR
jgi:hypothetical protein